jgi:large subunit ribosomal protein L10
MKKEGKARIIEQLSDVVNEYPNFYLVDIEALNADKTGALRRKCFEQNVKLIVVKNTLLKKVLDNMKEDYTALTVALKGNTAIMFSHTANVPARLIKELTKTAKDKNNVRPQLKAAYVQECFYVGADYLEALLNIKSKEELVGDLIVLLQSPAMNVISALNSSGQTILGILKTLEER